MTDTKFETKAQWPLIKPQFFYGDSIQEEGNCLLDGVYRWLINFDDANLFLPEMSRLRSLFYL